LENLPSLLDNCATGGCGAKIGPGELAGILSGLQGSDKNLIVGPGSRDDAAVYRIDDKRSLISTIDFFPPMVDDAKSFGRIAAANAISDVYAMGGTPLFALNIVCFPQTMDPGVMRDIMEGGAEKCSEAGVSVAGGHSIYDKEIKYGLCVTGIAETDGIYRNNTPRKSDKLILTKPLGTGIILAAQRAGAARQTEVAEAVSGMERLNKYAAEKLARYDIGACTDVTGFGLLIHLLEMTAENVTAEVYCADLPFFPAAREYAEEYLLTAAGQRNRNFAGSRADTDGLPFWMQELLFDPQTSGGLLIAVDPGQAEALLEDIRRDDPLAAIIGCIGRRREKEIIFG